jgi:hypothetical protein
VPSRKGRAASGGDGGRAGSPGAWIDAHLTPRLLPLAWLILTIGAGLIVRSILAGAYREHAGNAAWGLVALGLVWLLLPGWPLLRLALATLVVLWALELAQLLNLPVAVFDPWSPIGSRGRFQPHDLVGTAAGVVLGALLARRLCGKR